jgi:hypothetical protein
MSGKLSHEEWVRAEGRRAANRLRDQWKKNPWLPGSTIDLGEREWAFRQESGLDRRSDPMPPAVLDWLRWRYRRLQIDRERDREWLQVLQRDLPDRLLAAGPAPMDATARQEQERATNVLQWTIEPTAHFSKRSGLDRPCVPKPDKPFSLRGPGRPRKHPRPDLPPDQQQEIGLFVYQHRAVLGPMFERCREDEQATIIGALRAFVADPSNRGVRDRWMRCVAAYGG